MADKSSHEYKPGDRVVYAAAFLKSMQAHERAAMIGTVDSVFEYPETIIVKVLWDGEERTSMVQSKNLWPADKRHLEPH